MVSSFGILDPIKRAQAALEEARKAKEAEQATTGSAATESVDWAQQGIVIAEALEMAGLSGVLVELSPDGFATAQGVVASEEDQQTLEALISEFEVTGLDIQVEVAPPVEIEEEPVVEDGKYTVKAGESWWGIAARTYGDGKLYKALKAANNNPKMLHPGMEIVLPPKETLQG